MQRIHQRERSRGHEALTSTARPQPAPEGTHTSHKTHTACQHTCGRVAEHGTDVFSDPNPNPNPSNPRSGSTPLPPFSTHTKAVFHLVQYLLKYLRKNRVTRRFAA